MISVLVSWSPELLHKSQTVKLEKFLGDWAMQLLGCPWQDIRHVIILHSVVCVRLNCFSLYDTNNIAWNRGITPLCSAHSSALSSTIDLLQRHLS